MAARFTANATGIRGLLLAGVEERVLEIVRRLVADLGGGGAEPTVVLDASLERDLGIGSLERVELFVRLEHELVSVLGERAMTEAETVGLELDGDHAPAHDLRDRQGELGTERLGSLLVDLPASRGVVSPAATPSYQRDGRTPNQWPRWFTRTWPTALNVRIAGTSHHERSATGQTRASAPMMKSTWSNGIHGWPGRMPARRLK